MKDHKNFGHIVINNQSSERLARNLFDAITRKDIYSHNEKILIKIDNEKVIFQSEKRNYYSDLKTIAVYNFCNFNEMARDGIIANLAKRIEAARDG